MITSSRNPKDFINAQNRGKDLIIRSHELNGVDYDKSQSTIIENLIDLNVFDYDEYSYTLILTDIIMITATFAQETGQEGTLTMKLKCSTRTKIIYMDADLTWEN